MIKISVLRTYGSKGSSAYEILMITLWRRLNSSTGMGVGNEEEYRIELKGISSGYILKTDNIC